MLRIKDLNISADGGLVRPERRPVQTAKLFLQRSSKSLLRLNPEKLRSRSVDKLDLSLDIRHDDALLQRVENPLQKALLARKPDKIVLHLFRLDPPDALDELIDET